MKIRISIAYLSDIEAVVTTKPEKPAEIAKRARYGAPATIQRGLSILAAEGRIKFHGENGKRLYWKE